MAGGSLLSGGGLAGWLAAGGEHAANVVQGGFMAWAPWLVLFVPLAVSFLVACVPTIRIRSNIAAALAIGGVLFGFAITLFVYFIPGLISGHFDTYEAIVDWVVIGEHKITFGTRFDALALMMTLVVTGVGSAIFVYALGYMHGDKSMGRFYGKFSLFVFSMLGIVLSPNFFQTFVFWELVGVSSYLLIGYYWKKHSAGEAAKKAFMTNRVGDFGFLLGILMVWSAVGFFAGQGSVEGFDTYGAFDFVVTERAVDGAAGAEGLFGGFFGGNGALWAAVAAILVFCGAMGKSAQFPLHVWLPDAMEGPTPVSALMHAATMVAAGIYMVIRANFVFTFAEWAPTLICTLGAITAFIAATMAIVQSDIKKVLAYSTLSQLGYMTMALGAGAYTAAMFHLVTHAFFKALLFMCAGSVIHGCHHEQDMFKMGGLKSKMPSTYKTWMIGTLGLTAVIPIAGWWSKDEILGAVDTSTMIGGSGMLLAVGLVVAFMTAFYMFRATHLTFSGSYRGHHPAHESPKVMTRPLWALAIVSLFIGFIGIPNNVFGAQSNWIEHTLHNWHEAAAVGKEAQINWLLALGSTAIALLGMGIAGAIYKKSEGRDPLPAKMPGLWKLWTNLYYIDTFYLWLVKTVQQGIAKLAWIIERYFVIGFLVNGTTQLFRLSGNSIRKVHTGRTGSYITTYVVGAALILGIVLLLTATGWK